MYVGLLRQMIIFAREEKTHDSIFEPNLVIANEVGLITMMDTVHWVAIPRR